LKFIQKQEDSMKRWGLLCVGVLLFAGFASAQDTPRVEVFGGYSYLQTTVAGTGTNFDLGGSGSVAFNFNNRLGIVGDFGGYHTGSFIGSGISGNVITYLFGPRFAFRTEKATPFVQALFGGARLSVGGNSLNNFAMAVGGGFDWNVTPHFGVRPIEAEYVLTKFNFGPGANTQNSIRLSTGVTFRF
jgi:opacity protein-like surface antigen